MAVLYNSFHKYKARRDEFRCRNGYYEIEYKKDNFGVTIGQLLTYQIINGKLYFTPFISVAITYIPPDKL